MTIFTNEFGLDNYNRFRCNRATDTAIGHTSTIGVVEFSLLLFAAAIRIDVPKYFLYLFPVLNII